MLDEKSLRRNTFTEGHTLVLEDGQPWTFPKARTRYFPIPDGGRMVVSGGPSYGREFDAGRDVFLSEDTDTNERFRVKFEMAVRLLQANYNLADDQAASLIVFEPDDPASAARWQDLSYIVLGHQPQSIAATS
jgi:hypothetical protein